MANNEPATESRGRGRPVVPEEELIAKIREASLSLLLSQGYSSMTMDAVAKQAGVSKRRCTGSLATVKIWRSR